MIVETGRMKGKLDLKQGRSKVGDLDECNTAPFRTEEILPLWSMNLH